MGFLTKAVKPGLSNAWTGVSTAWGAGVVAFAATALIGGGKSYASSREQLTTGQSSYFGNIPEYAYDAQGQADRTTGDKGLGATGDLVFGLNASKHGAK